MEIEVQVSEARQPARYNHVEIGFRNQNLSALPLPRSRLRSDLPLSAGYIAAQSTRLDFTPGTYRSASVTWIWHQMQLRRQEGNPMKKRQLSKHKRSK